MVQLAWPNAAEQPPVPRERAVPQASQLEVPQDEEVRARLMLRLETGVPPAEEWAWPEPEA